MENKLFKTANEFSMFIEQRAIDEDIPCLQALIEYCDEEGVDYEDVARNVSKQLKEKLALNFADIGLMKRNASLDD